MGLHRGMEKNMETHRWKWGSQGIRFFVKIVTLVWVACVMRPQVFVPPKSDQNFDFRAYHDIHG